MSAIKISNMIHDATDDVRAALLPLIGFNVIVAIVSGLIFSPLVAWLFRSLVGSTGKSVLSDMEIAGFLLSPMGMASVALILVVFLSFAIVSSAGFMQILLGQIRNGTASVLPTLVSTLYSLPKLIILIGTIVVILLLIATPFLIGIALLALPLVTEFDINFYLANQPPEFVRAMVILLSLLAGMALVFLYLFVGWFLAVPLMLFQGLPAKQCLSESKRLVAGRRKEIGKIVLLWIVAVATFMALIGAVGGWLTQFLMSFDTSLTITALLMGLVLAANTIVTLAVSFIVLVSLNALIVRVYLGMAGESVVTVTPDEKVKSAISRARELPRSAWLMAGAVAITFIGGSAWFLLRDIDLDADVFVVAHRGSSLAAPENTMAALNLGLDEAADFIEIDVQENADGEIVVLHDADLKRVAGLDRAIADVTRNEALDIDIGSWFGAEFSEQRLPLLRDVLDAANGRAGVTIELKFTRRAVELTSRVVGVVKAAGAEDRVEYMSLSYPGTQELKALAPDASVGFLSNVSFGNLVDTNVDFLAVSARAATPDLISRAHRSGKRVYVWTVNTPREMALFIDRGVDGIITDAPRLLNTVMQELNDASLAERLLLRFSNEVGLEIRDSNQ